MNKFKIGLVTLFLIIVILFNKFNISKQQNVQDAKNTDFYVNVTGEVVNPGTKVYQEEVTLKTIIDDFGGYTENANESQNLSKVISDNFAIEIPRKQTELIVVQISGEVVSPGVYEVEKGSRVIDLLNKASGYTDKAIKELNLVKLLKDGDFIEVKKIKEDSNNGVKSKNVNESNKTEVKNDTQNEKYSRIIVEIRGEVAYPGVYELDSDARVSDLIDISGGLSQRANIDGINFAEKLKDEELIVISRTGHVDKVAKVNINIASKEELEKLPGVGKAISEKIINYRKTKMFENIEDLRNIENFSNSTYEKIKDFITV